MTPPLARWLDAYLPLVDAADWGEDDCWGALAKTRDAEHNPPIYWLGRALEAVESAGAVDLMRRRIHATHGEYSCGGRGIADQALQDVMTEMCAFAWATAHLGTPEFRLTEGGDHAPLLIAVPAVEAYVAPERLRPQRDLQSVVYAIGDHAARADARLPEGRSRILYLDVWHQPMYAQNLGYRLELTEPLQHAIRHFAAEHALGHVLTRPFQWGNPVEAWY